MDILSAGIIDFVYQANLNTKIWVWQWISIKNKTTSSQDSNPSTGSNTAECILNDDP